MNLPTEVWFNVFALGLVSHNYLSDMGFDLFLFGVFVGFLLGVCLFQISCSSSALG